MTSFELKILNSSLNEALYFLPFWCLMKTNELIGGLGLARYRARSFILWRWTRTDHGCRIFSYTVFSHLSNHWMSNNSQNIQWKCEFLFINMKKKKSLKSYLPVATLGAPWQTRRKAKLMCPSQCLWSVKVLHWNKKVKLNTDCHKDRLNLVSQIVRFWIKMYSTEYCLVKSELIEIKSDIFWSQSYWSWISLSMERFTENRRRIISDIRDLDWSLTDTQPANE